MYATVIPVSTPTSNDSGKSEHRSDSQIDPTGENDKCHSCRQYDVDGCLTNYIDHVVLRQKIRGENSKENTDDDEYGEHAGQLNQRPDALLPLGCC
jgi:hypothetical protein